MALRDIMLGDSKGKTAWQRLKEGWNQSRAEETWNKKFRRAYNPLGLRPGDVVEVGFLEQTGFVVDMVLWFHSPHGDPDYVHYGLKRMEASDVVLLEVMPGVGTEPRTVSLFELVDDFALDEQLLDVLDEEEVLQRTVDQGDGQAAEMDFAKEFVSEALVRIFAEDNEHREAKVFTYNYYREDEQGEHYLAVEVVEQAEWMNFYLGKRIDEADVLTLGTA